MSSTQDSSVIEIERNAAHLSSVEEQDPPFVISGIAIGEGDVTLGQSGVKKKWQREALKPAAETLEGRPLVEDHDNSSRGVVGEVTRVEYQDNVGVLYEAELYDEELAERIENGLLEVSIRGLHGDVEEMQEDAETGAKLVEKVHFDNLSIVPSGAAPSNSASIGSIDGDQPVAAASDAPTVESGPSTEVSAAECAEMLGLEEANERPEGAEKLEDDSKYEEMPERYPEREDASREEAAEGDDEEEAENLTDGSTDESSSHDDADTDEEQQSRGAGSDEGPEATLSNVTFITPNMTDTEEELSEYDDPHVIEGDDLEELREQADKVGELEERVEELAADAAEEAEEEDDTSGVEELKEQFEDDLAELKERTEVLDQVDRGQVEELSEADDPMVVESERFDELQETVSTVTDIYAESLSEYVGLSAEKLAEKMSLEELREELEEQTDADSVEEELSPDPKGEDVDEEELEEAADEEHGDEGEELSEEIKAEQERLRERFIN